MIIKVTQEDIDEGIKGSDGSCPIALACETAGMEQPCVDDSSVTWIIDGVAKFSSLPMSASNFIWNYDMGDTVEPFSFEIEE